MRKRKVFEAEYSQEGLNMINVTEFQNQPYLQWAGELFDAGKENWNIIPQSHLSKIANDEEWSNIDCKSNDITYRELIQNDFGRKL